MREAPFPSFTVVRVGKSLIFPRFPQFVVALLWEGWESLRSFSTLSTALFPLSCIKSGKVALSLSSDLPYSVFQVPEFRIPEVAWNQKVNLRAAQIQIVETA